MTLSGRDVLLVGHSFHSAQALTDRLNQWGFRCHLASDMRAAFDLMIARPVNLVLSNTHLPDGTGFDLLRPWLAYRFPRSSACRSKMAAIGCRRSTPEKNAWDCRL
jgi:DNA-binding NtrC family response regulator